MRILNKQRILDFDTENRPGFYWYDGKATDMLMAIAWKFIGEDDEVQSLTLEYSSASGLCMPDIAPFLDALSQADAVTGHNIRRHDVPLLNAHAVREGYRTIEWPRLADTMDMVGPKTKGLSRSQANLGDLLGLEEEKTTVHIPTWEAAAAGAPWALEIVTQRCEQDVLMHIELYQQLLRLEG